MRLRGLPLQGVDKGCQKGAQAGENLLEDLRCDLTFLKQLRFSNGISGVHGSAPSGAYIFVSRPQKDFIHNGLDRVNEAKTVELSLLCISLTSTGAFPRVQCQLPLHPKSLKAWGLRRWASFPPLCPCGRLSRTLSRGSAFLRPQTTMPRLTPSRTSGFRSGCPCSTLHSPYHSLEGLPCSLHRTYLWIALRWRVHLRVPSPLWGSPSSS